MPNPGEDMSLITNILRRIDLFKGLNEADHAQIIKRMTLEYFPKAHIIFREGDAADSFFVIKRGMVRVYHEAKGRDGEKDVTMLSDGDFFGEMALIEEKPRNATVQAMEESEIFKLSKQDFISLVSSDPNMSGRISGEFIKRLKINIKAEKEGEI